MSIKLSRHFVLRKLHQLTGIVPLGLFMLEHFYSNWVAVHGRSEFNAGVEWLHALPYLLILEIVGIWIPLLYHAIYGLIITHEARPNLRRYGFLRNWMYLLQRFSGIILVAFIAWHFYQFRINSEIPLAMKGNFVDSFGIVAAALANPLMFAWYVVGIGSVVFHLANGLWLFLVDWGVAVGPRAQRGLAYLCGAVGLGLFVFGLDAAVAFIRPGGLFEPVLR